MSERMFTLDEYEDAKRRAYDKGYSDAILDADYVVTRLPNYTDHDTIVRSSAILAIRDLDDEDAPVPVYTILRQDGDTLDQ